MKLYREVKIETPEQADALPEGTIAIDGENPAPYFKFGNRWIWGADGGLAPRTSVGLIALVPIEAEEEHKGFPVFPRPADAPWPPRSTPNQDADGRWYYIDEDGYSTAPLGDHPFHDLMVAWIASLPRITRYVTPWAPQQ